MLSRREFITLLSTALTASCSPRSANGRPPRILLCSAWQTVNIGDIAHTPGFLTLMERYLPEVETYLWPRDIGQGVEQKLIDRFPKLKLVTSESERQQAFEECDFFVHGSSASVSAISQINQWVEETAKGFGIYGITFDDHQSWILKPDTPEQLQTKISILNQAEFVFFRDSESIELAKSLGCQTEVTGFAPDAAFACDVRDDAKAEAFLDVNDLHPRQFLCCIAKYRYAPYWLMKENYPFDPGKQQVNEQFKEQDNAPLRRAVKRIVNETDLKILLCPEDMSEMAVNKELIYDWLTPAEKERVVWKEDYWLVGEAISVYRQSAGLFGNQMHSPIMCIGHGIPAITCRVEQQTSKGIMWRDIGLDEWLFNFDLPEDRERMPDAVVAMANDHEGSFRKAAEAKAFVESRQKETMAHLGGVIPYPKKN